VDIKGMINSSKLHSVSSLSSLDRYEYFIRKACDFEQVWGLFHNGWLMTMVDESRLLPIWPEAPFAAECATNEWVNAVPKVILIEDFLSHWLPGLKKDGFNCLVFMTPNDKGFPIATDMLHQRLVDEASQYE
jgi:hypothetical protein